MANYYYEIPYGRLLALGGASVLGILWPIFFNQNKMAFIFIMCQNGWANTFFEQSISTNELDRFSSFKWVVTEKSLRQSFGHLFGHNSPISRQLT